MSVRRIDQRRAACALVLGHYAGGTWVSFRSMLSIDALVSTEVLALVGVAASMVKRRF